MQKNKSIRLTESAIMLAFATVLSLIKIVDLPYGGSITACSMLPILIIAYRYGTSWGLFTAAAFSLLQLVTGMNSLSYVTSAPAIAAVILLDYIIAFMVLGLGGIFRGRVKNQSTALMLSGLLACVLRYACHTIAGCTVWAGLSIPDSQALLYSLAYNATYMVPETIILILGAVYVGRVLDFRSENITRIQVQEKKPDLAVFFSGIAKAALVVAAAWDVVAIAPSLQNAETGDFDITGITAVNWLSVGVVTAVGIILAVVFFLLCKRVPADSKTSLKGLFTAIPFAGVALAAMGSGFFVRNALDTIASKTEKYIGELTAGELSAEEAVQSITAASTNNWLQILVIVLAIIALLVLVTWRYFANKKQKSA